MDHDETGDQIRGREAVRDFIIALHSQLFDASPELVSTEFADGVAGLEAVFVGTHTAEFAGVPATGATVRLPYSRFYDIAEEIGARAVLPITALVHRLRSCLGSRVVRAERSVAAIRSFIGQPDAPRRQVPIRMPASLGRGRAARVRVRRTPCTRSRRGASRLPRPLHLPPR